MAKKAIVTGASGFVGSALMIKGLKNVDLIPVSLQTSAVEDIDFSGVDCIIHLAGIAHRMGTTDEKLYFDVNRDLTVSLAERAKIKGVGQFIFLSSSKVYGNTIMHGMILNEDSECNPDDPYGRSKWEAEQALGELNDDQFKVGIIRPPLIYGAHVKGNLQRLMKLIKSVPILPFKGINNKRSMVYVGNLIALIQSICSMGGSGTFIAGDRKAYSTTELVECIKKHMESKTRIIKVPSPMIVLMKALKPAVVQRLFGSYVIDNSLTNEKLDFIPPYTLDHGIREMVDTFKS